MTDQTPESPERNADRLAILQLCAEYAQGIDARDVESLERLFTEDAVLAIHPRSVSEPPLSEARERRRVLRGMKVLDRYRATHHSVGLPTIHFDGDEARVECPCRAHHLYERDGTDRVYVMVIRYYDRCVRREGRWLFAERRLVVLWEEDRALAVEGRLLPRR